MISLRRRIFIREIIYQKKDWNISYRTVVTDFKISPKNDEKSAFIYWFTLIGNFDRCKQKHKCRFFVIFRTNFKIRHDRSIVNLLIFLSIYNFPDKNASLRRNRAKTGRYGLAMFFYIFTAKLVILSQSIKLKTLNGHSSLRQPNTK